MSASLFARLRDWLSRATAPSSGRGLAPLPSGLRLYAIGDIHGEAQLLDKLGRAIEADVEQRPVATAKAVFLGDYIDRGPDSRGVIDRLARGRFPIPFEALRGNHEDLMLKALGADEAMAPWCHAGGTETMRSYGLPAGKALRLKTLAKLRRGLLYALPAPHRAFLEATKLSLPVPPYFFVHAGARPGVPLDRQEARDLMWIRHECYASPYDFGQVLVHGHTPQKQPENLVRRINVDTGAFKWGVLTAVVLEGDTRRFLSAKD